MVTIARRLRVPAITLLLAACVLFPSHVTVQAANPHGAYYSSDHSNVLWFIHVSDPHIGASGSTDSTRLTWLVTTARSVINPAFIVATGDLTDSTNGNIFGLPNGPYQAEWTQYKTILANAGAGADVFYDLPGNHDAYNDRNFAYYLANSVQGRATGRTQLSWTRTLGSATYHFLGVNTADNTGAAFSVVSPYGDHAGIDSTELTFIQQELAVHANAALTLAFGHHPVTSTGDSSDTYLYYGHQEFIAALDDYHASAYTYGHTHDYSQALFTGNSYTGVMAGDGIHYYNVASLGKSSGSYYSVVAIDCNGVSSITPSTNAWPVVLITAPVDRYIGGAVNPYAYMVPAASANPIRALVFDSGTISAVSYRIDSGATWYPMTQVESNTAFWETTTWNASALAAGNHTIEVRAVGTTTVSDAITVNVVGAGNRAPVAVSDSYTTTYETALNVAAPGILSNDTDADGDTLTASLVTGPAHGTLMLMADGSVTYAPSAGFSGVDSFTYAASDGVATSAAATVAITVGAAPTGDTVTITSATYTTKKKLLSVTATSSAQPTAVLTVTGFGQMTYKTKSRTYVLQVTTATKPVTVTVTSSLGGTATKAL